MTSFLNYVTATLRALFAWRGSYHVIISINHLIHILSWGMFFYHFLLWIYCYGHKSGNELGSQLSVNSQHILFSCRVCIRVNNHCTFSKTAVGCTTTYFIKILGCSHWFCAPLHLRQCIAYLQVPKGGCCSISDDLSCSCTVKYGIPSVTAARDWVAYYV